MIALNEIRNLTIAAADAKLPGMHISAASGLVSINGTLYVVADDMLHLAVFPLEETEPGRLIRLFDGVLPEDKTERKRLKPDLEVLVHIPLFGSHTHGALFAMGSGSRQTRQRGVLLSLDASGSISGPPKIVNLKRLFSPLSEAFPDLNIEGGVVAAGEVRLIQRGNKGRRDNAIIHYPLAEFLGCLQDEGTTTILPGAVHPLDLGAIDGIALGLTDATMLPDGRMLISAVAEDTNDAYRDGLCVGAALGIVDTNGRLASLERLVRPYKIEGISLGYIHGRQHLLAVTDADDPSIPAMLLSLPLDQIA